LIGARLIGAVGVDETLPDQIIAEADKQFAAGELPRWALHRLRTGLGYGNDGGWAFHHHHIHLSLSDFSQ
jgi:hypothetical protein